MADVAPTPLAVDEHVVRPPEVGEVAVETPAGAEDVTDVASTPVLDGVCGGSVVGVPADDGGHVVHVGMPIGSETLSVAAGVPSVGLSPVGGMTVSDVPSLPGGWVSGV